MRLKAFQLFQESMGIKKGELGAFGLLAVYDDCTPDDIEAFRRSLDADGAETFAKIDNYRRQLVAALAKLTRDEISILQDEIRGKYVVGFHELGNELMLLEVIKPGHHRL